MEANDLNQTLDNWGKLSKLSKIMDIRAWVLEKKNEIIEIGVDEFGYCEAKSRKDLLEELEEFLNEEIRQLK